jgi:hypothetical protein
MKAWRRERVRWSSLVDSPVYPRRTSDVILRLVAGDRPERE